MWNEVCFIILFNIPLWSSDFLHTPYKQYMYTCPNCTLNQIYLLFWYFFLGLYLPCNTVNPVNYLRLSSSLLQIILLFIGIPFHIQYLLSSFLLQNMLLLLRPHCTVPYLLSFSLTRIILLPLTFLYPVFLLAFHLPPFPYLFSCRWRYPSFIYLPSCPIP